MWQEPKTDWITNPINPRAADFNRIESNIKHVLNEIENKKGGLVTAINKKQNLVTLESSYEELANAIGVLNQQKRFATGSITYAPMTYGGQTTPQTLIVDDLPFTPSIISIKNKGSVTYALFQWDGEKWVFEDRLKSEIDFIVVRMLDENYSTLSGALENFDIIQGGFKFVYNVYFSIPSDGKYESGSATVTWFAYE